MIFSFKCRCCGPFVVEGRIGQVPTLALCPRCNLEGVRDYKADLNAVIYNAEGFSNSYWNKNPGKGQPWDKKEWLNKNWSDYYNEPPPKPDSKGTYDGT